MRTPRTRVGALAIGVALVTTMAGCGGSGSSGPPGASGAKASPQPTVTAASGADGLQTVTIRGTDSLTFSPSTVIAHTGRIRVTFEVPGGTPHTFAVAALHVDTGEVSGGGSKSVVLDVSKPGTYTFTCDFHRQMTGRLVVR